MDNTVNIYNITPQLKHDERGWTINPLSKEFRTISDAGHLHIVSITPGSVRGNHIHTTTAEWIVCWGAKVLFVWEINGEKKEMNFDDDKAYLVQIPMGVCHACKNIDTKDSYLFSYYEKEVVNYDKTTIRKTLLS